MQLTARQHSSDTSGDASGSGHDSERRLWQMIDALPAAIYTTDAQGRLTHFNAACVELSGREPQLGTDQWCVSWKLYRADGTPLPLDECPMAITLKEGRAIRGEEIIAERPDGTRAWVMPYPTPLFDDAGNLIGGINMLVDISDQKRAETTRAFLASVVENSNDAIITKNLDAVITSWNKGAEGIFGYTAEETLGKSVTMLIPPDRLDEEPNILARLWRGERVDHFETVRVRKDGTQIDVSLTISPLKDDAGRFIGISKIVRDITQRKQAERALRDADRRKDEFLATLAHELRNPLAPISNALQLVRLRGTDRRQAVRQAYDIMERQLEHLVRLVDDLLDVSRITGGKIQLHKAPVDLATVIARAVESSRPLIEQRRQRLEVKIPEEFIAVEADVVRLSQVLLNLLNNAAKYTPEGGDIKVSAHVADGSVAVSVKDTGMGIPREMLSKVFDLFTQVEHTLDHAEGGLGIGLTLVRRLTEMHGGTVEARSDGPGQGSEFVVRLPILANTSAAAVADRTRPLSSQTPRLGRVMVVDDNRDSLDTLATLLKLCGNDVRTAHDGRQALALARAYKPEVVLLDIAMPEMDGLEVCRRLRAEPGGEDVLIIAMTGFGAQLERQRTQEAGFDEHLVKPVALDALKALLTRPQAVPSTSG